LGILDLSWIAQRMAFPANSYCKTSTIDHYEYGAALGWNNRDNQS